MKKILFAACMLLSSIALKAQIVTPVHWSYAAKKTGKDEAVVFIKGTIDAGWHVYSQTVKDGGPVKTTFTFPPSKEYTLIGKTQEPTPVTRYEKVFSMDVSFFESSVIFQQKIKLKGAKATVTGKFEYMTCNDKECLPPDEVPFSIAIN
jgi:hypothetical protein